MIREESLKMTFLRTMQTCFEYKIYTPTRITLKQMLRTLSDKYKSSWKNHLSNVIYVYNFTGHSSTGHSLYYLMFGRKPRLPIDLILRSEDSPPRCNHKEYLESWKKEMEVAFEVALTKSTGTKEKDVQRKLKSGPCLGNLEPVGKVLVRNLSPRGGPVNLRPFWEQEFAEVIERHENDVTYAIKTISQPDKGSDITQKHLMPVSHILQTVDYAPNTCLMKGKLQKKVKSAMRKEAIEQDQRDLSNPSDASESDEEELELTPRQFELSSKTNLKRTALKEVQELTSDLTEEETNLELEVTERSTESSNKITALVYPTQNKHKTHKSSSKIAPTILDTTKNKTRVTKVFFHILILRCKFTFILIVVVVIELAFVLFFAIVY